MEWKWAGRFEGRDALSFALSFSGDISLNLGEIVDLFYDNNNGTLCYNPEALRLVYFFYRGPGLIDIVKRIVEGAPVLNQYNTSKFLEDMEDADGIPSGSDGPGRGKELHIGRNG